MSADLEYELSVARMKAVQYESSLLNEVVKLQRMKIEQLERQLHAERTARLARWNLSAKLICRNCGLEGKYGQLFCSRPCMLEYQRVSRLRRAGGG
jgi:hypothetical protein